MTQSEKDRAEILADRKELAEVVRKSRISELYEKYPDLCNEDGCGYDQVIDTENFNGTPRQR